MQREQVRRGGVHLRHAELHLHAEPAPVAPFDDGVDLEALVVLLVADLGSLWSGQDTEIVDDQRLEQEARPLDLATQEALGRRGRGGRGNCTA